MKGIVRTLIFETTHFIPTPRVSSSQCKNKAPTKALPRTRSRNTHSRPPGNRKQTPEDINPIAQTFPSPYPSSAPQTAHNPPLYSAPPPPPRRRLSRPTHPTRRPGHTDPSPRARPFPCPGRRDPRRLTSPFCRGGRRPSRGVGARLFLLLLRRLAGGCQLGRFWRSTRKGGIS